MTCPSTTPESQRSGSGVSGHFRRPKYVAAYDAWWHRVMTRQSRSSNHADLWGTYLDELAAAGIVVDDRMGFARRLASAE